MNLPLAGRGILVTRPLEQTDALAEEIRDAGGEAIIFPAMAIVPVHDDALAQRLAQLATYDVAIFISPNAVRHGLDTIDTPCAWPEQVRVYALGPGTARALKQRGLVKVIQPDGHDTEALLALPSLHAVANQRIVIFRGVGGRELLADTLRSRGAIVEYAECYRRLRPESDAGPIIQRWTAGDIHAVTINSAETLHNLATMLGDAGIPYLRATPVFAPHEKIAQSARAFGIEQVVATAGGDAGLVDGLVTWFQRTHE